MKEYLENRIKQLKEADAIACEKRWNMDLPRLERALWRENSNELTARRRELEDALEFLNGNSVPQPKQEVFNLIMQLPDDDQFDIEMQLAHHLEEKLKTS